jgi:beta-lactam-binding protein with PASTA domain
VAGGVLVLVIGVIIAVVVMGGGPKVPKVVGMDYPTAVAELKKKGYAAAPEIKEPAPDKPWARCSSRIPKAARRSIPKGSVKLTVAGVPTTAVPSVTGLDYPTAVAALEKSGFKVGPAIEEVSNDKGLGLVFKQEPAADAQADPKRRGQADGGRRRDGDGADRRRQAARRRPGAAGGSRVHGRLAVVGKPRVKQPDVVLVQDPAGDTKAPKGSVVTLTVDPGVVVPNLLSPQVDGIAGIQALKNAGWTSAPSAPAAAGRPT